ncbi:MAG: GAF domain-containing protein [Candidatus Rokuibacteriota bacterium]|nr:MAG: GAF domain-containing protein [Candidatus Rokubacteria bacterium]
MAGTSGLVSPSVDVGARPGAHPIALPFRTELSLAPLIRFWTQLSAYSELGRGPLPGIVRERIKQAPELSAVIDDVSVIAKHQQLVDLMMSAMFPPAFWQQEYGAALFPFQLRAFYATSLFRRTLMNDDGTLQGRVNGDEQRLGAAKLLLAYELILERTYGIDLGVEIPVVFTSKDPATTLERHFRLDFDWRFVDVKLDGPPPKLTDAMRRQLQSGNVELDQLRELVPPETATLRGFMTLKAVDVTDEEVLSSLKRDLIDKESIVSSARFESLQAKLRTLFRRPGLHLGLAAVEGDRVLVLNDAMSHDHACIFADSAHHKTSEFAGSLYERAVIQNRPVILDDLAAWPDRTPWEEELIAAGARAFVCAPLHYQDKVIGTLELISPRPGDLNATHLPKLEEVLPLFSMAVQRSVEELNARVQAMIKEKCTAIHPVVEWRFRKAVLNTIERKSEGVSDAAAEMEPIVFENVYPLYGLADIRGSSAQRGVAIQADLLTQLRLAADVLRAACEARSLPALDELRYRVDKRIAQVQRSLNSDDETGIVGFLRANVESLFDHLGTFGTHVRARIELYRGALDTRLGVVYRRRQLFEESVTRIAEAISGYLDHEELAAQAIFPHYFEKQKTDGVDYQIYVGPSLLEDGRFDPICLKNLRLWQLMLTSGIAVRAHQLRERLPVPLETTHLILVQHTPRSIRFRFDEKRFDVDGAYDIRYEIVKKGIDKAVVEGTSDRVTQPGKIAIIYSQSPEGREYRGYIEYLQSLGYLTSEVEELDLGELQGVQGLRALRVAVALENPSILQRVGLDPDQR